MTTIVYRDGIMAADSRAYGGRQSRFLTGVKKKVHRCPDGTLVGGSSSLPGAVDTVLEWFWNGGKIESFPGPVPESFSLLVVKPDGSAYFYDDSLHISGPIKADFYTIGSGMDVALGALSMGATASQAVDIACIHDPYSAGPIFTVEHDA